MKIIKDLQYNQYSECKLDLYIPETYDKAIVLIHGGGLVDGSKDEECYADLGKAFASKGYLACEINYRMLPKYKFPDFLEDAADAVKYLFDYIKGKNVPLYVGGHSAGAYISIMICLDNHYLEKRGMKNSDIAGWLIDSSQMTTHFHLVALDDKNCTEKSQRIDKKAPLFYVNDDTYFNKMLLISYTDDMPCRLEQNKLFYKLIKWTNGNIKIKLKVLEGGHCAALTQFDEPHQSILVNIFDEFIKTN